MHLHLGNGLIELLVVGAIVDTHQQITGLDELEVLHRHLIHIPRSLRADDRNLPLDHGVLGGLDLAAERWQLPCIQDDQHAHQRDAAEQQCRQELCAARTPFGGGGYGGRCLAFRGGGNGSGGGSGRFGHEVRAPEVVVVGIAAAALRVVLLSHRMRMLSQISVRVAITAIKANTSL